MFACRSSSSSEKNASSASSSKHSMSSTPQTLAENFRTRPVSLISANRSTSSAPPDFLSRSVFRSKPSLGRGSLSRVLNLRKGHSECFRSQSALFFSLSPTRFCAVRHKPFTRTTTWSLALLLLLLVVPVNAQSVHSLQGRVIAPDGLQPQSPVRVTLTFSGRQLYETFTDLSGRYSFTGLSKGTYQSTAAGDDRTFETTTVSAEIPS